MMIIAVYLSERSAVPSESSHVRARASRSADALVEASAPTASDVPDDTADWLGFAAG